MNIPVAIQGATGYTGAEMIRIIHAHPNFDIAHLGAHSQAGKKAGEVLPSLGKELAEMTLAAVSQPLPTHIQLVFTALPHGAAAQTVKQALDAGIKVVDLSADFRHRQATTYRAAYGADHPFSELLADAVYGITEFAREKIRKAQLVANPGCYPTSTLLPLVPLLKTGLLECDRIIVDAKSGTSGAGRSLKPNLLFCEANESVRAYGLPRHRHVWEIEEWASNFSGRPVRVRFVPHILPMNRGMLTTLHLSGKNPEEWHGILKAAFASEAFVRVLEEGSLPATNHVAGSNRCDIGLAVTGSGEAVIISCLDNLLKGAVGQAVQNANLMFGLEEHTGLSDLALWP
jgi:N-acetyl-gamma-glutamyl-phosphate reductase